VYVLFLTVCRNLNIIALQNFAAAGRPTVRLPASRPRLMVPRVVLPNTSTVAMNVVPVATAPVASSTWITAAPVVSTAVPTATVAPLVQVQCVVCLMMPVAPYVLVPCGHAQFCSDCLRLLGLAEGATGLHLQRRCPTCRAQVTMSIRYFCWDMQFWLNTVLGQYIHTTIEWLNFRCATVNSSGPAILSHYSFD
jgi:hypothetical protein